MDTYYDIPREARCALRSSYTKAGTEYAWRARWRTLGGRRMCDVWAVDPEAAMNAIEALNLGAFV